jgi:dipeptidyl-peptidase-4
VRTAAGLLLIVGAGLGILQAASSNPTSTGTSSPVHNEHPPTVVELPTLNGVPRAEVNESAVVDQEPEAPSTRIDPVVRDIEGWTVHIDRALLGEEHSEEGARALSLLANHLQRIAILVPEEALAKLRTIGIWIEHDHPRIGGMTYHPSRNWLVDHGHDPRLTRMVHIAHAGQLLSRQQMLKHPAVILHELAHGYHDQFFGFDHPEILAAYRAAKESGRYDNVLLYTGERVRHYGMNDQKEYFAEGTEAYFYRNDFYPFVRAELAEFDPILHKLLGEIWGLKD